MTEPTMISNSPGSNPALVQKIQQLIQSSPQHSISFAEFMAIALYEPDLGYYAASHRQLGPMGDFVTSSHLTHDYGELIGVQLQEFWNVLGQPAEFTVVEMGPGQGLVSADALTYLLKEPAAQEMIRALRWTLVETSDALIRWQRHYLTKRLAPIFSVLGYQVPIVWSTLDELKSSPFCGCLFSNELIDAFPFHLLQYQSGDFYEVGISCADNDDWVETLRPLSHDLAEYMAEMLTDDPELSFPEGYRCEVNMAAKDWVVEVGACLQQGYLLTIDYGYPAAQLYSPVRQGGTMQCYTQQNSHDNPYINIGNQDITSHVNFTALEKYGLDQQLEPLGLTQQGVFLMSLGLGDRLTSNNANSDLSQVNATLQRREALHALMNPMGLGGFKVLLQGKGLTLAQKDHAYKGFQTVGPLF